MPNSETEVGQAEPVREAIHSGLDILGQRQL